MILSYGKILVRMGEFTLCVPRVPRRRLVIVKRWWKLCKNIMVTRRKKLRVFAVTVERESVREEEKGLEKKKLEDSRSGRDPRR
ncbi:hypothetical protein MTR_1g083670 [Medicago truncatula]|uniref:Uncharacterized protein n=1 Tax=Medicago truncatula TaxID=3880 RepID=G7I9E3_MEDTR|nr:hypothetical protein MTR_1g083670 [Medicago truncatula]